SVEEVCPERLNLLAGSFRLLAGLLQREARLKSKQDRADNNDLHQNDDSGDQGRCGRVATGPEPGLVQEAAGPGLDRFAGPKPAQVFAQVGGTGIAAARFLVQTLQADGLQGVRQPGLKPARRDG